MVRFGQKVNNMTPEINGRSARVYLAIGTSPTITYCGNGLLIGIDSPYSSTTAIASISNRSDGSTSGACTVALAGLEVSKNSL